jgi:hypothetical protein
VFESEEAVDRFKVGIEEPPTFYPAHTFTSV